MKRTFKNREKQGRETNLWIKLFDTEKGFIGEFEINPPAKTLPHVVLWGDRVFVQNRRRAGHLSRKSSRRLSDSGSGPVGPSDGVVNRTSQQITRATRSPLNSPGWPSISKRVNRRESYRRHDHERQNVFHVRQSGHSGATYVGPRLWMRSSVQ